MNLLPEQISTAQLPRVYESAKSALAECETLDECKDWSDKSAALASYAKQASDEGLETMARRIRNRAIRRMGQVLEQVEPGTGKTKKDGDGPLSRKEAAREAGISERQQKTALRVASLSDDEFKESTEGGKPATLTQLAARGTKKRHVEDHTGGRDPKIFNRILHFVADLESAAQDLSGNADILTDMNFNELTRAQAAAETLREIAENIEAFK